MAARKKPRDELIKLTGELDQRKAELAVINSVQQGLASRLEMQEIYDLVGDKIREIFDAQAITLYTFDLEKNMMIPCYMFEMGVRYTVPPLSIPPLWKEIIRRDQPLMINTGLAEFVASIDPDAKPTAGVMPRSALAVPLRMNGSIRGVISVQNVDHENAFSQSDLDLLCILGASMSVALENARLFNETQQRNAELAIINSVQEGLASRLEMEGIYQLVGDKIREIFEANTVTLATFDFEKNLMMYHYVFEKGHMYDFLSVPIQEVWKDFIRQGQPRLINSDLLDYVQRIDPGAQPPIGEMPKSVLAVPLMLNGVLKGVVSLQNMDRENAFRESDVRLLTTLTNSMSVALENARLWEQEKLFRKALQRELEIGREIQAGFLPVKLPRVEGWEITASLMSAREVAGDFYDVFELPDGNIGLVIADVCDKGVGAALFMTLFRSLIRAASNLDHYEHVQPETKPHSINERLQLSMSLTNDYIAETHGESGMFATLFFGILDPRTGRLAYVNGGHEPPLILRDGTVRARLEKTGPAVGVIANYQFKIAETDLQARDVFFAFTDGLPDCKNPQGEFYGHERLNVLLRKNASAHELIGILEAELNQYVAGAPRFDDITLLTAGRKIMPIIQS